MRPDKDTYFMQLAYMAARRATCNRKHVGAVIVTPDGRTVSTGYNGAPAGRPSCDEVDHEIVEGHCVRTIHAEANAISYAGRAAWTCQLYVTVTPCYDCAKLIANAGITRVVYDEFYASRYGKSTKVNDFLREAGIEVVQLDTPGLALFKKMLGQLDKTEEEILANTLVEFDCGCSLPATKALQTCDTHGAPRKHG